MTISIPNSTNYISDVNSLSPKKGEQNVSTSSEVPVAASSNFASGVVVVNVKSIEEQNRDFFNEWEKFVTEPINKANSALTTVSGALKQLESELKVSNPQVLSKKWDFVLSDGKISVTGLDESPKDKQYLENSLNKNSSLVKAVTDYYGAVATYYENTAEHTSAIAVQNSSENGFSHSSAYFSGVESQINGKLPVMEMMRNMFTYSDKATSLLDIGQVDGENQPSSSVPFESAVFNAASYLTASTKAQYTYSNVASLK
jgi:hypothetical protein